MEIVMSEIRKDNYRITLCDLSHGVDHFMATKDMNMEVGDHLIGMRSCIYDQTISLFSDFFIMYDLLNYQQKMPHQRFI